MDQYLLTVIDRNIPYCGPGSESFCACIFLTIKPNDSEDIDYDGDPQMSREGLIMEIIRCVVPSLKKIQRSDVIRLLYRLFADATADSFKYGAFDGTMDGRSTFTAGFKYLLSRLESAVIEDSKKKSPDSKHEVKVGKDLIELFEDAKPVRGK